MARKYSREFIPRARAGAYALLESAGFDVDLLTEEQRQAIRRIYRIDGDNRSVSQLIQDGEFSE